jgi:predicted RNase H-like HicB family nuclease
LEASRVEEELSEGKMEYLVILEKGDTSFGAYVPDLPGCVAVGETKDEALELIREAIEMHIETLRESGEVVPEPHSFVETVAVQATRGLTSR